MQRGCKKMIRWFPVIMRSESRSVVFNSLQPHGLYSPRNSPGQNTGVGSLSLLQEIFPTQGSNSGLPCGQQILYQLSHKGSPRQASIPPVAAPSGHLVDQQHSGKTPDRSTESEPVGGAAIWVILRRTQVGESPV